MMEAPAASREHRTLIGRLYSGLSRLARTVLATCVLALIAAVGLRAYDSTLGPPLRPWHTIAPGELDASQIAGGDWNSYVQAEARMFEQVHRRLQAQMQAADRTPLNRYNDASIASPLP